MSPRVFDLLRDPLSGRNLLEASAGTGKTYTIAGLFLRLLLEEGLEVDQILVVTFTEAATEELRDRIRRRIREALEAFRAGGSDDDFLAGLLEQSEIDPDRAVARLTAALWRFDEAAVHTIHGFCQRVLAEQAFEWGVSYDAEVTADESSILEEVVADYWSRELYSAEAGFIHYLEDRKVTLRTLVAFADRWATAPNLTVIPDGVRHGSSAMEAQVRKAYCRVQGLWRASGSEAAQLLCEYEGLNRGRYRAGSIPGMARELDCLAASDDVFAPCERLDRWAAASVAAAAKKGHAPLEHPLFDACQELLDLREALGQAYDGRLTALKRGLLDHVRTELPRRKAERNLRSFDDLLLDVYGALTGPWGDMLARSLGRRYRAALIDEFQDTDPVQYGIFRKAFGGEGARLFLIGDPKQAIYSFRGADLFAYLNAAREADARFTLDRNWRSTPDLLDAVNAVFGRRENPFLFSEIGYQNVHSGDPGKRHPLVLEGSPDPAPLQVWFAPRDGGKVINKGVAETEIPRAVAGEVLRLLRAGQEGCATIDGVPLGPGHIACLVRTNRQARLVQGALQERRVPSVIHSAASLFASREAEEMLRLLAALAEPGNESRVRAALATDMVGISGDELAAITADDLAWDGWLDRFRRYHEIWLESDFVAAARSVLAEEGVRARLLAYADGERRLTNVLHCVEVLQHAAAEEELGPEGLLRWFGRRLEEEREAEEYQIRLETDAEAVKVVTVHRAKGLEYPVVFCPFLWEGLRGYGQEAVFHDPTDDRRLVLDLGSEDLAAHQSLAFREELAEGLRLLYVALTRAKQRTYLVWGRYRNSETSPVGYLLHAPRDVPANPPGSIVEAVARAVEELDDAALRADLEALVEASGGKVAVADLPPGSMEVFAERDAVREGFDAPLPPEAIPSEWGLASFSGFTSGGWDRPASDRDALSTEAPPEEERPPDIFALPKGARTGNCLHAIFEALDFTERDPAQVNSVVAEKLALHGFEPVWLDPVAGMVARALAAPVLGLENSFRLGNLDWRDRLTELEFHLPIARVTPEGLGEVFRNHRGSELPEDFPTRLTGLGFRPVRGLLKGFIDLVFQHGGRTYLLDWKSNHLGNAVTDYGPDSLREAMDHHDYHLQAHLYSVALHRYLRHRVPGYRFEEHFGGAVYVFLRGVDPEAGETGIVRVCPSRRVVEALDRYFAGGGGGVDG